ncbi:sensor histidine kinase [Agromyces aerolatus]|uniref:sensor histidine kinase n=1 Tax=Agromyces sp. LY-1074 TaxID=3074080 RepID=UPI002860CD22|nr:MULTISPECIES: histidine kinase [unclassified Agromyces]MDR5698549.1 histidine kinase [Agromyces sp. LY-1074]MDR5704843.1 histidine kinase [Agromyces sp. LY-1358]
MPAALARPEHARSVQTTWYYTLTSIVFFIGFLEAVVVLTLLEDFLSTGDPFTVVVIAAVVLAAAAQIRYCWFLRAGRAGGLPAAGWTFALVGSAGFVWALGLFAPASAFATAVPLWAAVSLIACLVPRVRRWAVLALGVVLFVAHIVLATVVLDQSFDELPRGGMIMFLIYSILLPFMLISSLWWWEIVVRMDRLRRTAAELAVTQERLRFASDLHDIQGHHLQVISLKSELAERLLEVDPVAAREHIHETRLIAKQALEETRSLVAGYRQVALDDELENAREVLTAAGASCALRVGVVPTEPSVRAALASVVREATTNILRHSEATRVTITLGAAGGSSVLSIENDGVAGDTDAPGWGRSVGSGLAGLRERLADVGGRLETSTDASGGMFVLTATVPVEERSVPVGVEAAS